MNNQSQFSKSSPQPTQVEKLTSRESLSDRERSLESAYLHLNDRNGDQNNSRSMNHKRLLSIAGVVAVIAISAVAITYYGKDRVSDTQKQDWANTFAAAQPLQLPLVSRKDNDSAIAAMPLPPDKKAELKEQVDNGRTRLVWLSFQDVAAEDGDQVRVESGAYSYNVTIMHAVEKVALPEPPGGVVNVQGIHDGGGGITIAITSGRIPVNLPYMVEGQTVGVPVQVTQP